MSVDFFHSLVDVVRNALRIKLKKISHQIYTVSSLYLVKLGTFEN